MVKRNIRQTIYAYCQLNIRSKHFALTMSEINASIYLFIFLYFFHLGVRSTLSMILCECRSKKGLSLTLWQHSQFPSQCAVANFWLRSWKGETKPSEGRLGELANVSNEMSTYRWGGEQNKREEKKKGRRKGVRRSGSRWIKEVLLMLFNWYI